MENTFITGLSGQMALHQQMDIVANNIANMSTPGFKAQNAVFSEYMQKPGPSIETDTDDPTSLVMTYGQFQNDAQGPIKKTGNPLDVALEGPGYFGVNTPDGVMYTRAGNFSVSAEGELVTSSGMKVAGEGGGPISIPADAREIKIGHDGTIATDQGAAGKLMIVEFESSQALEARGNGLYFSDTEGVPTEGKTRALQGTLEGSNVQPVLEMTRMIDISRSYQRTQQMLQSEHERQRSMIQRLSKPR
ncbi:MAG: flagellar basal-body rod protein FlgF [Alphaproteobacteria bacterium]|jgi:flagellar basal-body rod protein FlgF|nr:flagellar basal-body rod protein FlgF [Alphaproteobacteria bacterium]MDP7223041.1 flagellar basal-body rod protein FlgF [Alphaproteobacteria bacterium]